MADERTGAAKARYNGIAEWYDAYNASSAELNAAELAALLGRGSGLCLDLVAGWHEPAPWWKPDGIRRRTGMRHVPLMDLVNAFVEAGLTIERMVESGGQPVPSALGIRTRSRLASPYL